MITSSVNMNYEQRCEYFEGHGLDAVSVDKYYDFVNRLNKTYKNDQQNIISDKFCLFFQWFPKLLSFYFSIVMNKI